MIGGGIIGVAVAYKRSDQGSLVHGYEKESYVDYTNPEGTVVYFIVSYIINQVI